MRSAVVASSSRHPKACVARILGVRNSKSAATHCTLPNCFGCGNCSFLTWAPPNQSPLPCGAADTIEPQHMRTPSFADWKRA